MATTRRAVSTISKELETALTLGDTELAEALSAELKEAEDRDARKGDAEKPAEAPKEVKPMVTPEERAEEKVPYKLPKSDVNKDDTDIFCSVNFSGIKIKRGANVKIARKYAEVLDNMEKCDNLADERVKAYEKVMKDREKEYNL